MKAWLRAAMAALFVGSVVYLVWEERYRKLLSIREQAEQSDLAVQLAEMHERTVRTIESIKALDKRGESGFEKLEAAMRQSDETLQRLIDETDMTAVALGHPDLARDPVSAKFRLAIEEKRRRAK